MSDIKCKSGIQCIIEEVLKYIITITKVTLVNCISSFVIHTCWVTKEEIKRDTVATAPPINTVMRIPILSTMIPAIGEKQSVDPNVNEPINATNV